VDRGAANWIVMLAGLHPADHSPRHPQESKGDALRKFYGRAFRMLAGRSADHPQESKRDALRKFYGRAFRRVGRQQLWRRCPGRWQMDSVEPPQLIRCPTRTRVAAALRAHRAAKPDPKAPSTLGWRAWLIAADGRLASPHQRTIWPSETLRADDWSDAAAVRGEAGIHARQMPRDWRRAGWSAGDYSEGPSAADGRLVTGVVERFGRAVIGETGWRAEQVVIRELLAPDETTFFALQWAYPGAVVYLATGEDR